MRNDQIINIYNTPMEVLIELVDPCFASFWVLLKNIPGNIFLGDRVVGRNPLAANQNTE